MIINAANERLLKIGIKGENIVTGVDFSAFVNAFRAEYGSVSAAVAVQRAGDEAPYLKPLTDEGVWMIGAEDITPGGGYADLICTGGETVKKWRFKTLADDSLGDTADPPEVWRSYVDQIAGLVDSIENMTISAVQSDTPYVIKSKDAEGRVHLTFGLVMGKDGVSPVARVDKTDTGARVTITDASGTTSADITDGKDAEVTADSITTALGYTPADAADLHSTLTPVYTDSKGRYLNADGKTYAASKYATCDFIAVVPGMTLHLEGFRADARRAVCTYNRSQELVKVLAVGQPVGYVIDEILPDDAYFIRACTDYDNTTGEVTGVITGYLYGNVADMVVKHDSEIAAKQDTLVSGQTIKTINGESLLGSGDIETELAPIKRYEKIEEYIFDIDGTVFMRSAEPDGTPYKFARIKVVFECNGVASSRANMGWMLINGSYYLNYDATQANESNGAIITRVVTDEYGDTYSSIASGATQATTYSFATTTCNFRKNMLLELNAGLIVNSINWYQSDFKAGQKITIYAVRA